MEQTQYATETYTDMHLANELAKMLSKRVAFAMAGIISPPATIHYDNIQDNLEEIKFRMFDRTERYYKLGEYAPGKKSN